MEIKSIVKEVYLDHAATTYLDPRVKIVMEPYWEADFGNPAALYRPGRIAKDAVEGARATVAKIFNCRADDVIFTAGSTEADNLAIFGTARAHQHLGKHIITSAIEHHVIMNSLDAIKKEDFEVSFAPVDEEGILKLDELEKNIRPDTIIVSVMYANNEIGTIQPIAEIGKLIKRIREERKAAGNQTPIFFHSDAAQAAGFLDLDVQKLGVDLFVVSGSKIYGPKGIAAMFVRQGVRIKPIFYGGGQERNIRSGTESVPLIVGMAEALRLADEEREKESARLAELRDYLIKRLTTEIPKTILNGHPIKRLPNNVNVSVLDIEGEGVILYLDAEGIYISTGSACTSLTLDPSHVILALGRPYEHAHASLRFTLGKRTTKEDLDYVMEVLPRVVVKLRQISPLNLSMDQREVSHPEAFAGQGSRVKVGGKTYK
ncbi:MAG: cysteine desulfurase family protein [bacterium]|nr:cysteine desulfurase family protein [bacterium]